MAVTLRCLRHIPLHDQRQYYSPMDSRKNSDAEYKKGSEKPEDDTFYTFLCFLFQLLLLSLNRMVNDFGSDFSFHGMHLLIHNMNIISIYIKALRILIQYQGF